PFFGSLRWLDVSYNRIGPEGPSALLEQNPPMLHTLRMADNDLGDEGASGLAGSPASCTLQEVDLGMNGMGDGAARALAKSKHLRNLLVLWLGGNRLGEKAAAALARSRLGKRLAVLETIHEKDIPF